MSLIKREITEQQYNDFKTKALEQGILRRIISISEIDLISDRVITYQGNKMEMTDEAFAQFITILGLSSGTLNKIDAALGEKNTAALVAMMKAALSTKEDKHKICMLINQVNYKVVGFTKSAQTLLSNTGYFKLFEDVMSNHKGMVIKNMGVTESGNVEISVVNKNWEFNLGGSTGLKDEYFQSGLVFINTPDATIINPFNERLVCQNGAIATQLGLSMVLKSTDKDHMNGFFDKVRNLKDMLNFEQNFKNRVFRMIQTPASLAEFKQVRRALEYHLNDIENPDVKVCIESFVPMRWLEQQFLAHHIQLHTMKDKLYKKIKTHMSVWELVNKLTDISSQPWKYGVSLKHGNSSIFEMQKLAGEIMFKQHYDFEDPITQIF